MQKLFSKLIEIKASENGDVPTRIMLLRTGRWNSPTHGMFEVNNFTIDDMISNFQANVRKGVPIDKEHRTTDGAVGWTMNLEKVMEGAESILYGDIEWTPEGKQLLKDKVYKFFSPEFALVYQDPETGAEINNVFIGGAITNRPLMKDLQAIIANENNNNIIYLSKEHQMDLETIMKKKPGECTTAEMAFLKKNVTKLSDDQKKKFGLKANEEGENMDEEKQKQEEAEKAEAEAKAKEEADKKATDEAEAAKKAEEAKNVNASEVKIAAAELNTLKAQAAEGAKAFAELEKIKVSEKVNSWLFNEKNGGKFPTTSKDKVVEFYLSLSENQQKAFEAIVNDLPNAKLFGEIGGDEKNVGLKGASDAMVTAANEVMQNATKEGRTMKFADAIKEVAKTNKALYDKYIEETEK